MKMFCMHALLLLLPICLLEAAEREAPGNCSANCSNDYSESALLQSAIEARSRTIATRRSKGARIAEPSKVFVSGLSSGADFAVQFQVAFSARVSGAAIFAGQPYRCATTRFPLDKLQPPNPVEVPICEGCPPGKTLIYDHCKHDPSVVEVGLLKNITENYFEKGLIDDPSNMGNIGVYCYRGTKDTHYGKGSVKNTAEFFAQFASSPSNVKLVNDIPSGHGYPLRGSFPFPCGTQIPVQDCHYDGLGHALTHIYNIAGMQIRPPKSSSQWYWSALKWFDQEPFWGDRSITRLDKWALAYVPERCASSPQRCNLMLSFHGCGLAFPILYDIFIVALNLNSWAQANDMVVLYPRLGAMGSTSEQKQGCWNVYGQTGADYATQKADQMNAILQMVNNVTKLQVSGSIDPFTYAVQKVKDYFDDLEEGVDEGANDLERFADMVI